jgi:signal peptidase I
MNSRFILLVSILLVSSCSEKIKVTTNSMAPTINKGEFVVIEKHYTALSDVKRWDIIAFYCEDESPERKKIFIKRVFGLPGENIYFRKNKISNKHRC